MAQKQVDHFKKSSKPVLSHNGGFTLDAVLWALDKTVLTPAFALVLAPALALYAERGRTLGGLTASRPTLAELREVLLAKFPWVGRLALFVLLRTLHRAATRYVKNNGAWRPDKPDWSRDVVLVTGGSLGIGRSIVEVLSHKHRARIAVLDMAEPTYASAPVGAPEILYIKTDVTDPEQIRAAGEKIRAKFGRGPSYLVLNAGIAAGNTVLKTEANVIEKLWKVSTAILLCTCSTLTWHRS